MKNIIIVGTNDIASANAIRLYRAGFGVCMVGQTISYDLFSFRNFSPVLQQGSKTIENIKALSFADFLFHNTSSVDLSINNFVNFSLQDRQISVLEVDDIYAADFDKFNSCINCDTSIYNNIRTDLDLTTITCGAKNNIQADYFVSSVGDFIGRVKYPFLDWKEEKSGTDNSFSIYSVEEGIFIAEKSFGEFVKKDEKIASINSSSVYSTKDGYILGVIDSGLIVAKDTEIFRLTSNPINSDITKINKDCFSIAGGVLEAILYHLNLAKL